MDHVGTMSFLEESSFALTLGVISKRTNGSGSQFADLNGSVIAALTLSSI